MSDLSGPAFRPGYEAYVTGYPISGDNIYCLAKTWYAPELPRPGCVWTHTLLIGRDEMTEISDVQTLLRLFRRPRSSVDIESYEAALEVETASAGWVVDPVEAALVLQPLYATRLRLVIFSENSTTFESLVLSIFSQQWPGLRSAFRFCTGAISIRESDFDLSVSPPGATHSLGRNGIALDMRKKGVEPVEDWVSFAAHDICDPDRSRLLRNFLWHFGPAFADGRTAFRGLTEVCLALTATGAPENGDGVLSALARSFSNPSEAVQLKAELFGKNDGRAWHTGDEHDILRLLVSHAGASSIPSHVAQIFDRAAALTIASAEAATAIATLALNIQSDNAARFIDGYASELTSVRPHLAALPTKLVGGVLERHPTLASDTELWQRPDGTEIMAMLIATVPETQISVQELVFAQLRAGAWSALRITVAHYRASAVKAVLSFFDTLPAQQIAVSPGLAETANFENAVLHNPPDLERLGPTALAALATMLDPRSHLAREMKPDPWLRVVRADASFCDELQATKCAVFLLVVGLERRHPIAAELVSWSLSKVYAAIQTGLIDSLWDQLESSLPWFNPSWDRSGRLVRGCALAFFERAWPPSEFAKAFATEELLGRAAREVQKMWGGWRYLRQLKNAMLDGSAPATAAQLALLARLNL